MRGIIKLAGALVAVGIVVGLASSCGESAPTAPEPERLDSAVVAAGRDIFRFDTYGDEKYWTDTLRMHEVIQSAVSPATALSVGLKVDASNPTGAPGLYAREGFVVDQHLEIWRKAL